MVVTTGGAPAFPLAGVPADGVFTIRTLEDAIALRTLLDAGRVGRALVVGAGYIGLEMAEAFAARGCAVTVVARLERVLPNLDAEVAALVEKQVRRERVDLKLGTDSPRRSPGRTTPRDVVVLGTGCAAGGQRRSPPSRAR